MSTQESSTIAWEQLVENKVLLRKQAFINRSASSPVMKNRKKLQELLTELKYPLNGQKLIEQPFLKFLQQTRQCLMKTEAAELW